MCSICHNKIENNKNIVITECMHKFHFSCIYKNINHNYNTGDKCPLCREYFNKQLKNPRKRHISQMNSWQTNILNSNIQDIGYNSRSFINRRAINRNTRRRNIIISTQQESPHKKIKKELGKLTFYELKEKMRSHNVSTNGYIRDNLEKRLIIYLIRNNIF